MIPPSKCLNRVVEKSVPFPARKENVLVDAGGTSLVGLSRVHFAEDKFVYPARLKQAIHEAIDLAGGLSKVITKGDRVLVKVNINSDDPFPASTDLLFLRCVIRLLKETGASRVDVADSSGLFWVPTDKVIRNLDIDLAANEEGSEFMNLEQSPWWEMELPGTSIGHSAFSSVPFGYERLVYVPGMKAHRLAGYTLSLKLTMGLQHLRDRIMLMHTGKLLRRIAEINLAFWPDLIIMDGRKSFSTGGPNTGKVVEPGVVLASGDRVAIDSAALDLLTSYGENGGWNRRRRLNKTLRTAIALGIGRKGKVVIPIAKITG